jgi:hypothetical protein
MVCWRRVFDVRSMNELRTCLKSKVVGEIEDFKRT